MSLYGRPTAGELVEAVEEFLRSEVLPSVDGRLHFHTLVAANVLAIVGRELLDGPAAEAAHVERLAALGFADDEAMAAAIRAGALDEQLTEVLAVLRPSIEAKVAATNPKHLDR